MLKETKVGSKTGIIVRDFIPKHQMTQNQKLMDCAKEIKQKGLIKIWRINNTPKGLQLKVLTQGENKLIWSAAQPPKEDNAEIIFHSSLQPLQEESMEFQEEQQSTTRKDLFNSKSKTIQNSHFTENHGHIGDFPPLGNPEKRPPSSPATAPKNGENPSKKFGAGN